jgi:hypothetical protein
MRRSVIVFLLLLTASAGVAGQSLFQPKRDPYRNLFGPSPRLQNIRPRPGTPRAVAPTPKVVCGMVVVPADPSVDPKIFARQPDGTRTFSMRSLAPPMCKPE